jgi:DNA-binding CsgD family transcriptional regulator/catechol 2,3-dioxygenase-like lactoylglutathione lyase family enzyme
MVERSARGRPPHPDILTPAEWRIAHAVRHGMTTRAIARRQGVSVDAVKFHLDNIRRKLGLQTRAQLRTWAGVPADSMLRQNPRERGSTMSGTGLARLGQVSRRVSDIEKAVAWYRDVLGLPHLYTFGDLAFFDLAGTRLFLTAIDEGAGETGESILYFAVDDIHEAHASLEGRGVVFTSAPHLIHRHDSGVEEWMAFFDDPDGRALGIMSQSAPARSEGA